MLNRDVHPFLEKRGLDAEFFIRLSKGEIPPKPREK